MRSLFFYYKINKNRFAHALATCGDFPRIRNPYVQYACYRLGLYHTVTSTPLFKSKNWRGGFAWAVSLAACGRHEESKAQVHSWLNTGVCDEQKANLADCLVPFQPELAHEILQGIVAPATLRSAICLRVGQNELARKILADHLTSHSDTVNPEAWLYYSNASEALSSIDKLENLNRFLDAYQVPRLRMIDELCPPSPMNVQSAEDYPVVSGPLVTVLMTAYNSAARITSAIRSVITQSYRNIELIVIDDTSSDMTSDIVKTIMEDDKRVKFMSLPRNVGPYVAKNMGLLFAKGEFITCHDSDDWSHPLKIERQVTPLLKNRKLICTTSDWVRMQDDGTYYARPVHPLQRFNPSSPLFRRKEVLETIGAWDCVRTGADSEFIARLKLVFGRKAVLKIRQPLAFGSHRQGSLMTSPETGYSSTGISPLRLAYWESWTYWHIYQLRAGKKPRMPSLMEERAFSAPSGITVTPLHIALNLEEVEREYF
ncbi:MAG: glycosyltransferase family 2 protein [Chlorobiaceae bacterium]